MAVSTSSIITSLGINVGTKTYHVKTITEADVMRFAEVSGDFNPVHMSEEFAEKTFFRGRIVHGILTAGLISAAIAKLPGLVIYLSQALRFLKPIRIGDSITATAEVVEKDDIKGTLKVKTTCVNHNGEIVLDGEAKVKIYQRPCCCASMEVGQPALGKNATPPPGEDIIKPNQEG